MIREWDGLGFPLQNRGGGFILEKGHINTYGESGFDYKVLKSLMNRGHNIRMATGIFGGYQAIMKKMAFIM